MQELWKLALGVAGLGGVACFVFWSLYKNWLKLPIFQQMTKEQQFSLFKLFMWLTFIFAALGLVSYVIIQLAGPAARASENSVNELTKLVQSRRATVLDLIDRQDKALALTREEAAQKGKPTQDVDAKVQRLRTVKERFDRLSGDYIAALNDRQFVRSHEVLRDIHALLDDAQTQALFLERVVFGDQKAIVYVPTRRLTRSFFMALPKGLDEKVGAALLHPNPFGQDYPDPDPPSAK